MKTQTCITHTSGIVKGLLRNIKKMTPLYNADAIHAFRVSYKKARALLRLASVKKAGPAKMNKPLKKLYHKTGEVRDLQLLQQKTEAYCHSRQTSLPQYQTILQGLLQQLIQHLPAALPCNTHRRLLRLQKRVNKRIPFANRFCLLLSGITVVQYHYTQKHLTSTQLHLMRKSVKDIYYNRFYLGIANREIPELTTLMEQLGRYQDYCRAICLLGAYPYTSVPQHEKDTIAVMKATWLAERRVLKARIQTLLYTTQLPSLFPWLTRRLQLGVYTPTVIV